ncbi:hypothetical protein [Kocuria carniphila]|uniref:hypothetical protein n=1 Tax=Kocuria carniphila TaxID=262208 RepID=UPI0034DAD835
MPTLTKGQINITPISIRSNASLDDFSQALLTASRQQMTRDEAWGSVYDDPDLRGMTGFRILGTGQPAMFDEDAFSPRRIKARLYWWATDYRLLEYEGLQQQDDSLRLEACDILISETDQDDDEFLCLASTRRKSEINAKIVLALENALQASGHTVNIQTDNTPLSVIDGDFFFWLMYRHHTDPNLTPLIRITYLRHISGQDLTDRGANLRDGIELDRSELLAMIMGGRTNFGPATASFYDEELHLEIDASIHRDGGFSIVLGHSRYDDEVDPLSRTEKGIRMTDEFAFKVLKEVVAAYNADNGWRQTGRRAYVEQARDLMKTILDQLAIV